MTLVVSLTLLTGIYLFGILLSKATNGRIPSALSTLPVMFALFWTNILTPEGIEASKLPAVYALMMAILLVNAGSTFDLKMLIREKRITFVCLASLLGCGILVLTVGWMLFGRDMAIVSYPSLCGGLVATVLMQEAALEKGLVEIAAIVVMLWSVQQWVSMPVISNTIRAEARRMLNEFNDSEFSQARKSIVSAASRSDEVKLIDRIPEKYASPWIGFFICCLLSALAEVIASFTGPVTSGILGTALVGIIIGVVARACGVINKDPITKMGLMPFFMFAMIMSMRVSLASLSPTALLQALWPLLGMIVLGLIGLCAFGVLVGKLMGISVPMSICLAVQAYSGYPINYQIGLEVIEAVASTPEEIEYLKDSILTKVVVGGVVSVSISSVIIGSIFANLL